LADFCIHHFGQLNQEESRSNKAAAYLDLLRLKVQELPDDAMAWLQLGLQEYECSRKSKEPFRCFERALALELGRSRHGFLRECSIWMWEITWTHWPRSNSPDLTATAKPCVSICGRCPA